MSDSTPEPKPSSQSPSRAQADGKADRLQSADSFIERGMKAEADGNIRRALIHYEDALYFLGRRSDLELHIEALRKKAGEQVRDEYRELIALEKELSGDRSGGGRMADREESVP